MVRYILDAEHKMRVHVSSPQTHVLNDKSCDVSNEQRTWTRNVLLLIEKNVYNVGGRLLKKMSSMVLWQSNLFYLLYALVLEFH